MAEIAITNATKCWDVTDCLSTQASVVSASSNGATGSIKKGYPVFAVGDGSYVAYAPASIKTQTAPVGVVMSDIENITKATIVNVMFAGKVYIEGVREAGVTVANAKDSELMGLNGKLVFVPTKEDNYSV